MKARPLRFEYELAADGECRDAVEGHLEEPAAITLDAQAREPCAYRTPLQRCGRRRCREMREHSFDVPVGPRRTDTLVHRWKMRPSACDNDERVGQHGCHEHQPRKQALHASTAFVV